MSSSDAARRRSGDPRRRAGADSPAAGRGSRRWAVVAALAVAAALVSLAAVAVRPDQPATTAAPSDDRAPVAAQPLMHAEVACDLTRKAEHAAEDSDVGERARYAASVLLLDQAIIESGRAAESDVRLLELDAALQAVHTAGHEGDHDQWQDALGTANTECRTVLGGR